MAIKPGALFEIGLIVPDLEAAMEQFHAAFGYTFSPIVEGTLPLRDGNEDSDPPLRMAVSREAPQLELLEAQPGTAIEAPAGTGLHHLGYYVDDLSAASDELVHAGLPPMQGGRAGASAPVNWVYHSMADGTIVELVDGRNAALRRALVDGDLPDSPMAQRLVPIRDELAGRGGVA